jgi:hypothetical protein
MKTYVVILLFSLVSGIVSQPVNAVPFNKLKDAKISAERKHNHDEAATAIKSQTFLVSFYSFIDKKGNLKELEPEGNFILANTDKFIMQKSVSLSSNTFAGSDNIKGELASFQFKENRKGDIQFSFDLISDNKRLTFKGRMSRNDNTMECTIKGKREEHEIIVSGNIQPVKSHFVY